MRKNLAVEKGTLEFLASTEEAKFLIEKADKYLENIGYTEHGFRHAKVVSKIAKNILEKLGFSTEIVEIAAIAGYFHDIGNSIGRERHELSGAFLIKDLLSRYGIPFDKTTMIMEAVANHEDADNEVASEITAAVIIGDKCDVHRSRVRTTEFINFDIHDRVNYAVTRSYVAVEKMKRDITLHLDIDTEISSVTEYFEIFLNRMLLCRRAAKRLDCNFGIIANGARLA